ELGERTWRTGPPPSPSFLVSKARRCNPLCHNSLCAAIPYPNSPSPSHSRPRISTNRFWTFDIRVSTVCCRIFAALRRLGYRLITSRMSSNCADPTGLQVLKQCRVSGRRHFCHPTSFQGRGCENGRSTEDPASG